MNVIVMITRVTHTPVLTHLVVTPVHAYLDITTRLRTHTVQVSLVLKFHLIINVWPQMGFDVKSICVV